MLLTCHKKFADAKLMGSTLVAAFRKSDPPLIWKFDLERNHSFTLALQGEEGKFKLVIASPKGEAFPVAGFDLREDAEQAFAAVQRALMNKRCGWLRCLLSWVGGLAALALVVLLIVSLFSAHNFTNISSASSTAPVIRNGVPLLADKVLRPPP